MTMKFRQPTNDELSAENVYKMSLNPFWYGTLQALVGLMNNPDAWEDFSEVELAIQALTIPEYIE